MLKNPILFKEEILKIKDAKQLALFLHDNKIEIETDNEELRKHFEKYLNFNVPKENGIIFDLRNKASTDK